MGREPNRKGQHVLLYAACFVIIVLIMASCAPFQRGVLEEYHFARADRRMIEGEYMASLNEYKDVFMRFPHRLGDQALYRIGLVYAHPRNSFADNEKAMDTFQKLLDLYPESPLRARAELWILILRDMEESRKKIDKLNGKILALEKNLVDKQKSLDTSGRTLEKLRCRLEELEKSNEEKEKRIEVLQERMEILHSQLEDLKEIDLGIEEKKRISSP